MIAYAAPALGNESGDYRSRTIYFIVTDRFSPHEPFSPFVDPLYPDATNSVNCFLGGLYARGAIPKILGEICSAFASGWAICGAWEFLPYG